MKEDTISRIMKIAFGSVIALLFVWFFFEPYFDGESDYSEGYRNGYIEGHENGREEGLEEGYEHGVNVGGDDGYKDGYCSALEDVYNAGNQNSVMSFISSHGEVVFDEEYNSFRFKDD